MDADVTGPACPHCGTPVEASERFCEGCGHELNPDAPPAPGPADAGRELPVADSALTRGAASTAPVPDAGPGDPAAATVPVGSPCRQCGGAIDADGYCSRCGAKVTRPRDHFVEQPSSWVAGCCDRGVRHHRNEDALALAAGTAPNAEAVLVVCDGVSSSTDSDVASLAGARAARDLLAAHPPRGLGTRESRAAAIVQRIAEAAAAANEAVIANTAPDSPSAASCTFVAGVIADRLLVYGGVGDSRAYWVPDAAPTLLLTEDDSVAQMRVAAGVAREQAENGPGAHAITRWLGLDAEDTVPRGGALELVGEGWVLLCSDGLWNYASAPEQVAELLARLGAEHPEPRALAEALVAWANAQGGKDNVTVALARISDPRGPATETPAPLAEAPRAATESTAATRLLRPPDGP